MKTIGIIGGLGPEATTDYYKEIIKKFNEINKDGSLNYPEIIIYSVNMAKFIGHIENADYESATRYISNCVNKLKSIGADFAAISSNTPHLIFDEIQGMSNIPLISIVDSVRDEARRLNLRKSGLIGTKFTMNASFYANSFGTVGIDIVIPSTKNIEIINEKLFSELEIGIFKPETQALFLTIIQEMIQIENIDSLILGCTELPLMFTQKKYLDIPFLNTTRIHVSSIVKECLNV